MTGTLSIPTVGAFNSTEDPKIFTALTALNNLLTPSNLLDGAQLGSGTVAGATLASGAALANLASASVTDAKLASPNNSVYKTLLAGGGLAAGLTVAGTPDYVSTAGICVGQSSSINTANQTPLLFDFASGDYTSGSLTTKFRIKMEVLVGSTSPSTVTLTAGLYPVTLSSGNVTLGTVVVGSTALSSGLATNTISRFNSGDFSASALLADPGVYALGFAVGSITVPSAIAINLQLQTRNV